MAPAARVTASIARPEKRKTTAEPIISPTSVFGDTIWYAATASAAVLPTLPSAVTTASLYEPNSAVAASTAVAIAMPLVIALVVLPTASSSVRICAPVAVDVARHLGDALGVVAHRAEGVHRDDDADGGQQAASGERDEEERQDDRAAAEQVAPRRPRRR